MDSPAIPSPQPQSEQPAARVIPIDVEHGGIRFAVPGLAVLGFVLGYFLTSAILNALNADFSVLCVAIIGGIFGAILASAGGDYYLKRVWPSGRSLSLDAERLRLVDTRRRRQGETDLLWEQRINPLAWRFTVKRGSARVPKGWLMLSLQLLQDDRQMTLYTFMPEKSAATLPAYSLFTPLVPRAQLESDKLSLKEKSEQRRLLKAETNRWENGAEVRREDFPILLDIISPHIPEWQTRS